MVVGAAALAACTPAAAPAPAPTEAPAAPKAAEPTATTAPAAPAAEPTATTAAGPTPEPTPVVNTFGKCDTPFRLWHGLTGSDGAVFAEMLQKYKAANPDACFESQGIAWDLFFQKYPTAVAAGKLNETLVRDSIQKFSLEGAVKHRTLILPGYASPLSGKIQEETGWRVLVGPRDAAELGEFLEKEWKP